MDKNICTILHTHPSKDTIYGCSGVFNVFILISSSGVGGIAGSDVSVAALLRKTCVLCAGLLNCDVDTVMNTEDSRSMQLISVFSLSP